MMGAQPLPDAREPRGTHGDSGARRYQRYRQVIDRVAEALVFDAEFIKRSCHPEKPAFVTRIINQLVREGWLVCEEDDRERRYRWNAGRGEFSPGRWLDEKLCTHQVKAHPTGDRPRERLMRDGAAALTHAQLLAILVRSGQPGESAVMAGEKLARHFDGRLDQLPHAGRAELRSISRAIQSTAWCQIMAGIELGRRIAAMSDGRKKEQIGSSADAIEFCRRHFARLISDGRQEEFHIVTLDTKNQVIHSHRITVGTLDASLVHPREVFRPAIRDAAQSIVLVHNHPSGDPTPSNEDHQVTRRLESVGQTVGIRVLDHIVLGNPDCVSIRESR
jgi:DNA repair protein RadC